jgi:hypothetical protein
MYLAQLAAGEPAIRAIGIARRVAPWENDGGGAPNKDSDQRSFFIAVGMTTHRLAGDQRRTGLPGT